MYEFIKKDTDIFILKYKDKELEFKRVVGLVDKLQSSNIEGRKNMIFDMAKRGIKKQDLCQEIQKDGKTYVDNSMLKELENTYINETASNILNEIITKLFGMGLSQLIIDMGFTKEDEVQEFFKELISILNGKDTPSRGEE